MTPRQVSGLLKVIHKNGLVAFYESALSYKAWGDGKIPSLNEFLGTSLDQSDAKVFDEDTDKFLEAQALKRFEERLKNGN